MAKVRIPKRVGGVKIPKKIRRKARKAIRMAESPAVREFAAAALGAAAQAKAARLQARAVRPGAGATIRIDGDRLAESVRLAALDGLHRFLAGFEEGLRDAAERERAASGPSVDAASG